MINSLRSIVACRKVRQDCGRTDYLDVMGQRLLADSIPGSIWLELALIFDLDGMGAVGRIFINALGYDQEFKFHVPTRIDSTGLVLPLMIPVLKDGTLSIQVADDCGGAEISLTRFALGFAEGSQSLSQPAAAQICDAAAKSAAAVRDGLEHRTFM